MKRLWIVVLLLLVAAPVCQAKTQYVKDTIYIQLRTSNQDGAQVIRALKSGTPLKILEEQGEFSRVLTPDGVEGWVKNRYLIDQPIAADRLAALEKQLAEAKQSPLRLQNKIKDLQARLEAVEKERRRLETQNKKLSAENAKMREVAAEPLALSEENARLKQQNQAMAEELQTLRREQDLSRSDNNREWFMTGAGVVVLGIVTGLIIPRLRWRRRSEWS